MRQVIGFNKDEGFVEQLQGFRAVPEEVLMEIHEGKVLRLATGFYEGETFQDGACLLWSLAASDGTPPEYFRYRVAGYFYPHESYLPVVICPRQVDILEFIRHMEMEAVGDRDVDLGYNY